MIKITKDLWVGSSDSLRNARAAGVKAVLNVAIDLKPDPERWLVESEIEYAQVGLIDGPGNPLTSYCSAILVLHSLMHRGSVLVYDHDCSRALAVVAMYLNLVSGKRRNTPSDTIWSYWMTWEERIADMRANAQIPLPAVHQAHQEAFKKIPFGLLEALI